MRVIVFGFAIAMAAIKLHEFPTGSASFWTYNPELPLTPLGLACGVVGFVVLILLIRGEAGTRH